MQDQEWAVWVYLSITGAIQAMFEMLVWIWSRFTKGLWVGTEFFPLPVLIQDHNFAVIFLPPYPSGSNSR